MKVVSYIKTVPAANANPQKEQLLHYFAQGAIAAGDTGVVHRTNDLIDCNVAVIQGWVYDQKITPHLKFRDYIINTQKEKNRYTVAADANLFLYKNKNNPHGYLRYSFNGIFPNTGIYCDDTIDPERWNKISNDTGIVLEERKKRGKTIVLCLQRNGGWSMNGLDVQDWVIDTVKQIRKYTDRTIIVRPHPGDKKAVRYLHHRYNRINNLPNVQISEFGTPLEQDLSKAWAVVNHNSSSIVGPIIMGYNAYITDPVRSQCSEVAHHNFADIETPKEFDRERWLQRISMFHWKFSELQDGSCWRHMRNYCQ